MIDNMWAFDIPEKIFTIVSTRGQEVLKDNYPDTKWSMDDKSYSTATFPTVLFTFTSTEMGNDLMGQDINAIYCSVQIDVTVTKEQGINVARYVSGVVANEMKRLSFSINEMPQFNDNTDDLIRLIFRCRRVIGQADTL